MVSETEQKVGAVVVVGGGIAGMQASLDLAESGMKVYLVESRALHRRQNGPARQDLPHQRLRHVHHGPQTGRVRAPPQRRYPLQLGTGRSCAAKPATSPPSSATSRATWTSTSAPAAATAPRKCPVTVPDAFNERPGHPPGRLQAVPPGRAQRLRHRQEGQRPLQGRLPRRLQPPGLHGAGARAAATPTPTA